MLTDDEHDAQRKIKAILLDDPYWDMKANYYRVGSYYRNALGEMALRVEDGWLEVTHNGKRTIR